MAPPTRDATDSAQPVQAHDRVAAPAVTLPTGGGALRGIGETFSVNPATGTSSLAVPLAVTPGRSGFFPSLSLTYDSGAGNGPFGLGWSVSLPVISRKTERQLPRYHDSSDPDVYLLSGAEDLVRVLTGVAKEPEPNGYRVERYRPRIEGLFARIERWRHTQTGDIHWRSVSRDNVTTFYGQTAASRVADPADSSRIFKWLIDETRDDRGNVVVYEYKAEDRVQVERASCHEQNRPSAGAGANRYLKYVRYGNHTPQKPDGWHFQLVFDYGEHDADKPTLEAVRDWPSRLDAFSSYRSGFDIRTHRLCRRVLMFHTFDDLPITPCLVRSTDFEYREDRAGSVVTAIRSSGYMWDGAAYRRKSMPPVQFTYTESVVDHEIHVMTADDIEQTPAGVDGNAARWVDLDSEGLSGVLTQQAGAWRYNRNRGGGKFGGSEVVTDVPSPSDFGAGYQILDLANEGRKSLVRFAGSVAGYRDRAADGTWEPFKAFSSLPNIVWDDPNIRLLDVDGDGLADLLMSEEDVFSWFPSEGKDGFGPRESALKPRDAEAGAALVFADAEQSVYTADMSGDGLVDVVRIRNGEVCYWPNLGYGRFGAKVTMDDPPVFDLPDQFHQSRIRLVDIDGSGTTDIIYLGRGEARFWINQCGNRWGAPRTLDAFPKTTDVESVAAVDLLGNGTACLVWSSPCPRDAGQPMRYLDLTSGIKPRLLASVVNNLGAETRLQYAPSTKFYLEDLHSGQPWATKVPFVVHVIERTETRDGITGSRFVSTYRYRHGYYDPQEQEFRGFGYVEHTDTETYVDSPTQPLDMAPVVTKTWFHTGAYLDGLTLSARFRQEYYKWDPHPQAQALPDTTLPPGLSTAEQIEACRALKGQMLRQEIYADDAASEHPYTVSERTYQVRLLQARAGNPHAVFLTYPREVVDYHYERNPTDPRIGHQINLNVDDFGNVIESVTIGYPRRSALLPEQAKTTIVYTQNDIVNAPDGASWYRVGVPVASRTFEVTLAAGPGPGLFAADVIGNAIAKIAGEIPYEQPAAPDTKRLIARVRHLYYNDDLSGARAAGDVGPLALPYESYSLAGTPELISAIYGNRVTSDMLTTEGRYLFEGGLWWSRSGRRVFSPPQFYLPVQFLDPFGNIASVFYDQQSLLIERTESSQDPLLKNITIVQNDHRTMSPVLLTDPNGNRTAASADELGLVTATAVMGKDGKNEGDTLDDPTTRFEYDLFQWTLHGKPASARRLARERHRVANTRWLESYEYSDGFGRLVQKKAQAEPEPGSSSPRWAGSGRVIFNNKGKSVKQYEPFFSTTPEYEDEAALVMSGVTPIIHYDPVGRVVRTDLPNGTFSKVEFDPWQQISSDPNDTVLDSVWYGDRKNLPDSDPERRAADLAKQHAGTPSVLHLDALGRPFLAIADNGPLGQYRTHTTLDIQGHPLVHTDHLNRAVMRHTYDMLGRQLYQSSMDAGERWTFLDIADKPVRAWDSRGQMMRMQYDLLGRQTHAFLEADGAAEILTDRLVYGEGHSQAAELNLRGKTFDHYDGAGRARNDAFDFKGNAKTTSRRFAKDYKQAVDWSPVKTLADLTAIETAAEPLLEGEPFAFHTEFDALNRVISLVTPDKSETRPSYSEASLLDTMSVRLRDDQHATMFVSDINHDAKGQRVLIAYGNSVDTHYTYEEKTFRLRRLETLRGADVLQDLNYWFDPVGNITGIRDDSQEKIYFNNQVVSASAQYEYDAINRLTFASGREHRGQGSLVVNQDDTPRMNQPNPNDGGAMRSYTESYEYDEVGNLTTVTRVADKQSWTQRQTYAAANNRLLSTSVPGDPADGPLPVRYFYNAHGSMIAMPHLKQIDWNHREQMSRVNLGGGGTAYYVYDAAGQRARKVVERPGGLIQERFYLGGFEIYRERKNGSVARERQTLHVMDDTRRIAIVETKTIDNGVDVPAPKPLIRFQLGNHLGSASLELDDAGAIISYEEYYPYGSTSYQAGASAAEVSLKRYRYTGKERDEETSFYYHGARYYAPWVGRWTNCDPDGTRAGLNVYEYCWDNPVMLSDPNGRQGVRFTSWDEFFKLITWKKFKESSNEAAFETADAIVNPSDHYLQGATDVLANMGQGIYKSVVDHPLDTLLGLTPGTPQFVHNVVAGTANAAATTGNAMIDLWDAALDPFSAGQEYKVGSALASFGTAFPQLVVAVAGFEAMVTPRPAVPVEPAVPTPEPAPTPAAPEMNATVEPATPPPDPVATPPEPATASDAAPPAGKPQVDLPKAGERATDYGTRAHQELPRIVDETNPGAGGKYNVKPGLTGPDLENPTGLNATFAEMKSLWGRQGDMVRQAAKWGFDAQTGRYFFYDRITGYVFEGIIQTEKFASGLFR